MVDAAGITGIVSLHVTGYQAPLAIQYHFQPVETGSNRMHSGNLIQSNRFEKNDNAGYNIIYIYIYIYTDIYIYCSSILVNKQLHVMYKGVTWIESC